MRTAFISTLTEFARQDPSVFLVVGDLGFSVIEDFQAEFPDRFLNAGVAEQSMIGIAAGLASTGYKVFVYSIANFPTMRCVEQIRNDVCYHRRNVTIVSVGAGFSYGYLGYTHHAIEDIAVMRALPHMNVLSPCDPIEARALTAFAVATDGPKYLRLGKNGEPSWGDPIAPSDPLEARVIAEGSDLTVLVTGSIVSVAFAAREILANEGVSVRVVSVPRVKPLASTVLDAASGTRGVITLEEHSAIGGFGSAVLELAAKARVRLPILSLGTDEATVGQFTGSQEYLRRLNGLDVASIADAARSLLGGDR